MTEKETLFHEAKQFITACYHELNKPDIIEERLKEIKSEINRYGYYEHTYEELACGARAAWRNSNRCIGRLFWRSLHVFDARHLATEQRIYEALLNHITYATNEGKIRPAITIFKPQIKQEPQVRIWNHQLIRYAGYETENGVTGDPASLSLTRACQEMGWKGKGSRFDVLPLVIQVQQRPPQWFEIPEELVLEVPIRHPEYDWFEDLNIKWYAVPIISDMCLEIGGIHYTASPFNGWYMETEIGARNLADTFRYNLLPEVAKRMGLEISRNASLWKDKALVELNVAVLHSYKQDGVSIVDHHTAAEQFKQFEQQERDSGRKVTGDWTWLIPPVSPATTHIFHQTYENRMLKPNYFYQDRPYE